MAKVTVYTKTWCSFCTRAKSLLTRKGVNFDEINISTEPEKRNEMIQLSGRFTVPQIFINEHHVGGCDDLLAADAHGELERLINI